MRKLCVFILMAALLAGCSKAKADLPDVKSVVQNIQRASVLITVTYEDGGGAYGSGFFVSSGLIATAAHVVKGDVKHIVVTTIDGKTHVVDWSKVKIADHDVAVFSIEIQTPSIPFADKDVEVGDWVIASGHAGGVDAPRYTAAGLVFLAKPNPESSASIPGYPGMSGSPVVNMRGQLVGMVVSVNSVNGDPNGAPCMFLPLSTLKPEIEELTK